MPPGEHVLHMRTPFAQREQYPGPGIERPEPFVAGFANG